MRRLLPLAITAATARTILGTAAPASAAEATSATVTVTGGSLSISVPPTAGSLGTRADTVGAGVISGPLGQVQVNDARSAIAGSGWVASVIATAFTPSAGPAIAASAVGYSAGAILQVGTATYTANDPADLTGVVPAVTATGITGDNSATWNPTIEVTVPGGMAAGVYSATITPLGALAQLAAGAPRPPRRRGRASPACARPRAAGWGQPEGHRYGRGP